MLLVTFGILGFLLWLRHWQTTPVGLDQLGPFLVGIAMVPAYAWLIAIGIALKRGRRWARWAGLLTFALVIPGAASSLANVASSLRSSSTPYGAPQSDLVAPALLLAIGSAGVWALRSERRTASPG